MRSRQRQFGQAGLAVAAVAALSFLGAPRPAGADAGDVLKGMGTKLARGTVNIVTGWAEVPKSISDESVKRDPVTGFFVGTAAGAGKTIWRTGGGAYAVGTFLVPLPSGYAPVTEPDTVFGKLRF